VEKRKAPTMAKASLMPRVLLLAAMPGILACGVVLIVQARPARKLRM
jgi:hypothetical protein